MCDLKFTDFFGCFKHPANNLTFLHVSTSLSLSLYTAWLVLHVLDVWSMTFATLQRKVAVKWKKKISIFGCKWKTLTLKPWWSWAVRFYYVNSTLWTVLSKVGNRWFSFTLTRVAVITGSFVFLWDVIDWVCVIILHHASL